MKSPPPSLIPCKRPFYEDLHYLDLEPPPKRMMLERTFDPNNRRLQVEDTEMDSTSINPVVPIVGLSTVLSGFVGSQNTMTQVVPACIGVPELEQRAPEDQVSLKTEVRQHLRSVACHWSLARRYKFSWFSWSGL